MKTLLLLSASLVFMLFYILEIVVHFDSITHGEWAIIFLLWYYGISEMIDREQRRIKWNEKHLNKH